MKRRVIKRVCGECSVCCTIVGVASLHKPPGRPCVHMGPEGCSIFGQPERPLECSRFKCAWLHGADWVKKPDIGGVVAWGNAGGVVLDECWPGASRSLDIRGVAQRAGARVKIAIRWVGYE